MLYPLSHERCTGSSTLCHTGGKSTESEHRYSAACSGPPDASVHGVKLLVDELDVIKVRDQLPHD